MCTRTAGAWARCIAALVLFAGCNGDSGWIESDAPRGAVVATASSTSSDNDEIVRGELDFVADYDTGLRIAAERGQPLLLFFTAPWCRYCDELAEESFTESQVVSISERFVCVLVDADRQPEVCKLYGVTKFPTVQFLSPQGVPLNRVVGKKHPHQLATEMQSALQAIARRMQMPGEQVLR